MSAGVGGAAKCRAGPQLGAPDLMGHMSPSSRKTLEPLVHLWKPGTGPQLTKAPKVTVRKVLAQGQEDGTGLLGGAGMRPALGTRSDSSYQF